MVLCCGGFPGLCRRFSRISDLYLLAVSSTPQVVAIEDVPRHCKMSPGGGNQIIPGWEPLVYSPIQSRTSLYILYHTPSERSRDPENSPAHSDFPERQLHCCLQKSMGFRMYCSGVRACLCYSLGVTLGKPLNPFQVVSWYGLIPASQIYCKD